jgi:hypothetical protein
MVRRVRVAGRRRGVLVAPSTRCALGRERADRPARGRRLQRPRAETAVPGSMTASNCHASARSRLRSRPASRRPRVRGCDRVGALPVGVLVPVRSGVGSPVDFNRDLAEWLSVVNAHHHRGAGPCLPIAPSLSAASDRGTARRAALGRQQPASKSSVPRRGISAADNQRAYPVTIGQHRHVPRRPGLPGRRLTSRPAGSTCRTLTPQG